MITTIAIIVLVRPSLMSRGVVLIMTTTTRAVIATAATVVAVISCHAMCDGVIPAGDGVTPISLKV